ncbi:MAG: hypothetical protein ACLS28_24180 [Clostridium neonatale]
MQMAEPLLAAALLYAKELEYPFNNIEFAFKLIINLDTEQLEMRYLSSSNNLDCNYISVIYLRRLVGQTGRREVLK